MKNNDSGAFWFHIPIIFIKIVRILAKEPSGQPKTIELERWGKSIKVATDPELGRVRLEVVTLPVLSLEDKKSKLDKDRQSRLDLGKVSDKRSAGDR
jgi:hypothetical protein